MRTIVSNKIFFTLILLPVILFSLINLVSTDSFGKIDFIQYFTGGELIANNSNPYNKELFIDFQNNLKGNINSEIIYIYNPPVVFPFIYFLSFFNFNIASKIWQALSLFLITASVIILYFNFNFKNRFYFYLSLLSCFSFTPFFSILFYGQISFILFFFFTLHLYTLFKVKKEKNMAFISGVFLSVLSLKPHFLILLVPLACLLVDFKNIIKLNLGLFTGISILVFISFLFKENIFIEYFNYISKPPIFWKTPTLGSWIQEYLNIHTTFVRFIPTILMFFFLSYLIIVHLIKKRNFSKENYYQLLPLCLVFCPYFWVFDYVLILPALFYLIFNIEIKNNYSWLFVYVVFLFFEFLTPKNIGQEYFIYYPIVLFMLIYLTKTKKEKLF